MASNLYVHFPFCRRKCSYCALHSRVGRSEADRAAYVNRLASAVTDYFNRGGRPFDTVYFGGGSPALCDLAPVFPALSPLLTAATEFTVELHPLDVTDDRLARLADGGVNRISLGVQSLDDAVLADMGRGYTAREAARAFASIRRRFDNAGVDLILGYPERPQTPPWAPPRELADWGLAHCSVYSLILEETSLLAHRLRKKTPTSTFASLPDDDAVMNRVRETADFLAGLGLERYEISNYARPGCACRHNLAVWRGEDYHGLGEGAFGRLGLWRTENAVSLATPATETETPGSADAPVCRRVSADEDRKERTLFRLRTREGLDTTSFPEWREPLDEFVAEGLLTRRDELYFLTPRGSEVCDTILAELV